jgi:hypothetical protein
MADIGGGSTQCYGAGAANSYVTDHAGFAYKRINFVNFALYGIGKGLEHHYAFPGQIRSRNVMMRQRNNCLKYTYWYINSAKSAVADYS